MSTILQILLLGLLLYILRATYKIYRVFAIPNVLRNYPQVSVSDFLKYTFQLIPYDKLWQDLYQPLYKTSKYIAVPNFLGWELHINDVELAKWFTTNFGMDYEEMGTANTLMHHFMGTSVVLADGQDWQKQRPIINMAFSRLKPTTAAAEATKHMIGLLRDKMDQPLDIDPFMRRAMFRSLLIAIFDLPELLENDYDQYVSHTMDTLFAQALHPLYMMFPLMDRPWNPLRRKLFEQSTEFNQLINSITEKKREQLLREGPSEDKDRDLLTLMLQASMDPENAKLTDYELLGNIKALFLAGHETTATAMTLLMHLLAIHQDVQDKVREEVFRVLGCGPGALTTPTPDQQRDLEYLNAVVKECQRLYGPTAKLMPRITSQDVTLDDGTVLPKGTGITVDQMAILRSDKVWTNPEQFRPERHLDTREGRTPAEFITFSAGRRICPGMNLATVEQRVMLALCVQMFSWELGDAVNGQDIQIANTFILHPKNTVLKLHLLD